MANVDPGRSGRRGGEVAKQDINVQEFSLRVGRKVVITGIYFPTECLGGKVPSGGD